VQRSSGFAGVAAAQQQRQQRERRRQPPARRSDGPAVDGKNDQLGVLTPLSGQVP